ncbi:MAG: nucleoside recognition domain-containing protein [Sporomusaceae bacterium]|nr:nucleoside recognition domain-containing protein [Sporomusaceae bacterium]
MSNVVEEKITWKGWISLIAVILCFSGLLSHAGPLSAFDFQVLVGGFGKISGAATFVGKGGSGASDGFLQALALGPIVMLALGIVEVAEANGAIRAAGVFFRPILRPLLGIPGVSGLAFMSSFTSTDVSSVLTRNLYEEGLITDDERTLLASYLFPGSAVVSNTLASGAPLLPISVLSAGAIMGLIVVAKFVGTNLIRLLIAYNRKRAQEGSVANG